MDNINLHYGEATGRGSFPPVTVTNFFTKSYHILYYTTLSRKAGLGINLYYVRSTHTLEPYSQFI